jgi:hypothetical protein
MRSALLLKRGRRWSSRGALLPKKGHERITVRRPPSWKGGGEDEWAAPKITWTMLLARRTLNWPCDTAIHVCRWCRSHPPIRADE